MESNGVTGPEEFWACHRRLELDPDRPLLKPDARRFRSDASVPRWHSRRRNLLAENALEGILLDGSRDSAAADRSAPIESLNPGRFTRTS